MPFPNLLQKITNFPQPSIARSLQLEYPHQLPLPPRAEAFSLLLQRCSVCLPSTISPQSASLYLSTRQPSAGDQCKNKSHWTFILPLSLLFRVLNSQPHITRRVYDLHCSSVPQGKHNVSASLLKPPHRLWFKPQNWVSPEEVGQ